MTGRVFVVQRPAYYDRDRRGWVNKYDISPARKFGELVFLLKPGNLYRDQLASATESLRKELETFGPDDYILAIGDPIAISAAVLIAAARNGGKVAVLKFDRMSGAYDPYTVDAFPPAG